jgi:hypothetical protein
VEPARDAAHVDKLDLGRFHVGDVASTFLYASAINTVMSKAAEDNGARVALGTAFVLILLLDWLSRVFVLARFPTRGETFMGSSWLLIFKVALECVCVTLITVVAVMVMDGAYDDMELSFLLMCMFVVFAAWNAAMIIVLQHVDFIHLIRAIFQGYDGAYGVFENYLKHFADLLDRIGDKKPTASQAMGAGLKMTCAMLAVLFLCAHILVAPIIYGSFAAGRYFARAPFGITEGDTPWWLPTVLISVCIMSAIVSAVFASNKIHSGKRVNLGSVCCFVSILVLMFFVVLFSGFPALMWTWFVQVSCASFLVFFMSHERPRAEGSTVQRGSPTPRL